MSNLSWCQRKTLIVMLLLTRRRIGKNTMMKKRRGYNIYFGMKKRRSILGKIPLPRSR
uniref:Uncharacterized protein n=1 Tax=Brassica campestris TaxID=3711 RepID=A0A3P6BL48_BRACM|nr:unnamed protein product [Brassica rapa]